ncbi:Cyclin-dependent kinase 9 [Thelohanellus kitauei]|uniref:Cyclin-dependent kinase 9 n=1 Tax=Thelohanellus kitauei TaxID=669202 RepID=A0A0C2JBB6_THEKT|nr:Cyclin-dependent kinase 9 [Thelohanellus kitauei]
MEDEPEYPHCHDVDKYEKLQTLGVGTFGEVYKAKCLKTGKFVALKKFKSEKSNHGILISTLREIKLLSGIKHENIVSLIEVCRKSIKSEGGSSITEFYMVLELCELDLSQILAIKEITLSIAEKKAVIKMLLSSLVYMHSNRIIHRDIKASNILINKNGIIKLADFGLARPLFTRENAEYNGRRRQYSGNVVTLWYRAPELLLGDRHYGPGVDVWSAGCVMMELWLKKAFLRGDSEAEQINLIVKLCGSFSTKNYPGLEKLELYRSINLQRNVKSSYEEKIFPIVLDKNAFDLAQKLLVSYPGGRIDAQNALKHKYLTLSPLPADNLTAVVTKFADIKIKNAEILAQRAQQAKSAASSCMFPSRIY